MVVRSTACEKATNGPPKPCHERSNNERGVRLVDTVTEAHDPLPSSTACRM